MKNIFYLLTLLLLHSSCQKNEPVILPDDDMPPDPKVCVAQEPITSMEDSVAIFYAGEKEHGFAEAIKINKDFEAAARARIIRQDKLLVSFTTYYSDNSPALSEVMSFYAIPPVTGCYVLNNDPDTTQQDQVLAVYQRRDFDIPLGYYMVFEEVAANYLQIDSLDLINNYVSGQFMCSFKIQEEWADYVYWETPEQLRFFNGRFACKIIE